MDCLRAEQAAPAIAQLLSHMCRWRSMTVGHVLPVSGEVSAVGRQGRLLQLFDTLQNLTFGVGSFQRDVEVLQQVAEQRAIEQSQRFPRVGLPEVFGAGGDVVGERVRAQVQAESLLR